MAMAMPASCTSGVPTPNTTSPKTVAAMPVRNRISSRSTPAVFEGGSGVLFIARPEMVLLVSAGCLSLQSTEASLSIGKG